MEAWQLIVQHSPGSHMPIQSHSKFALPSQLPYMLLHQELEQLPGLDEYCKPYSESGLKMLQLKTCSATWARHKRVEALRQGC